jgi:predicted RNA methylase
MIKKSLARKIFEELYSKENGYLISRQARKKRGINDRKLTYGEVKFDSFYKIIREVSPTFNKVFYDLGSGNGKAVILASLFGDFKKLVGIEILDELVASAQRILSKYKRLLKENLPEKLEQEIKFVKGDMLKSDFSEADVVFTHSTCFDEEFMRALAEKMEGLKKGSFVITITQQLPSPLFRQIKKDTIDLSWGQGTVYFWEKIK